MRKNLFKSVLAIGTMTMIAVPLVAFSSGNSVYIRKQIVGSVSVEVSPPAPPSNAAPIANNSIPDQEGDTVDAFSYSFASNIFSDPGDSLTYSAALQGGGALPVWLVFNGATRNFSYAATAGIVGTYPIRVTATDSANQTATADFTLTVANPPSTNPPHDTGYDEVDSEERIHVWYVNQSGTGNGETPSTPMALLNAVQEADYGPGDVIVPVGDINLDSLIVGDHNKYLYLYRNQKLLGSGTVTLATTEGPRTLSIAGSGGMHTLSSPSDFLALYQGGQEVYNLTFQQNPVTPVCSTFCQSRPGFCTNPARRNQCYGASANNDLINDYNGDGLFNNFTLKNTVWNACGTINVNFSIFDTNAPYNMTVENNTFNCASPTDTNNGINTNWGGIGILNYTVQNNTMTNMVVSSFGSTPQYAAGGDKNAINANVSNNTMNFTLPSTSTYESAIRFSPENNIATLYSHYTATGNVINGDANNSGTNRISYGIYLSGRNSSYVNFSGNNIANAGTSNSDPDSSFAIGVDFDPGGNGAADNSYYNMTARINNNTLDGETLGGKFSVRSNDFNGNHGQNSGTLCLEASGNSSANPFKIFNTGSYNGGGSGRAAYFEIRGFSNWAEDVGSDPWGNGLSGTGSISGLPGTIYIESNVAFDATNPPVTNRTSACPWN